MERFSSWGFGFAIPTLVVRMFHFLMIFYVSEKFTSSVEMNYARITNNAPFLFCNFSYTVPSINFSLQCSYLRSNECTKGYIYFFKRKTPKSAIPSISLGPVVQN